MKDFIESYIAYVKNRKEAKAIIKQERKRNKWLKTS